MKDYKDIAKMYGISERMEALEKALLSISGVSSVSFDLSGYYDDIYQVIVIAGYETDVTLPYEDYFKQYGKIQKDIVRIAGKHDLRRTEDRLEDMGAHFYIVFSSSKWNENKEYALFYDHAGHDIPVGSEGWVPSRKIANRLHTYHSNRELLKNEKIFIKERERQRTYEPITQRYNGKPVYNEDYCYWNALSVGDYVNRGIYLYFVNCMTPACMRSDCIQMGEPASTRIDENGNPRSTYRTIKKVDENVYEYCGKCFRGMNVETGTEPAYT